jgi:hypothetical protein
VRTTLTLDEDVAAGIRQEVRRSGRPFRQVVNDLLRTALHMRQRPSSPPPFTVHPRDLGLYPGLDYVRIPELLEEVEGPFHR